MTLGDPAYERAALLVRLTPRGRAADDRPEAVCARPASIAAALDLQREGRVVTRWEDGFLIVRTPAAGPLKPAPEAA